MVTISIDPKFHGPTIADLAATLSDIPDNPLTVGWRGSKEEARLIAEHPEREFIICVPGMPDMSQAAFQLGAAIQINEATMTNGMNSLVIKKTYNWREFSSQIGPATTRSLVVKLAADAVRAGRKPKLASVAIDIIQGRANPADADVLMRTES